MYIPNPALDMVCEFVSVRYIHWLPVIDQALGEVHQLQPETDQSQLNQRQLIRIFLSILFYLFTACRTNFWEINAWALIVTKHLEIARFKNKCNKSDLLYTIVNKASLGHTFSFKRVRVFVQCRWYSQRIVSNHID